MALLVQIVRKRAFLSFATVCTSVLFATVTLWWNAQLSDIIDTISGGGTSDRDNRISDYCDGRHVPFQFAENISFRLCLRDSHS